MEMEEVPITAPLNNMSMKICNKCSENVKVHVTCSKCSRIYHPKCLIKAPTVYMNEMGQLFCCQNLTSKCHTFETISDSQENKNVKYKEEDVCNSDDGLEYSEPEQHEDEKDDDTCDASFKKQNTLEEENENRDDLVCSFCEVQFYQEKPYKEHIQLCVRNDLWMYKTHGAAKKLKKMYKCDKCNYQAKWASLLKAHLNIHSNDKRFKCTFKRCKCMQSLDTSQVKHCDCSPCKYRTGLKINLQRHILQMHSPEKKLFKCNDCMYTARQKNQLKHHIFTHLGLKPFRCGTCEYATVTKNLLNRHIAAKHSNQIDFACSFCKMKFVEKKSYEQHRKLCGRNDLQPNTTQAAARNKKLHKCDKCTFTSKWLSHLKTHSIIHSSEKPFKCTFKNCICTQSPDTSQVKDCNCSMCEYSTGHKEALQRHMFRHTNKGIYKCNDCTFTNHQKKNLREHILFLHLGEKPYVCGTCGFASAYKRNLYDHIKAQSCGNHS